MSRAFVVIGTPCFGGLVHHGYMSSVVYLLAHARKAGVDMALSLLASDALITRGRATLVAAFLDNPAATHILFVDADISFAPEQFSRLLAFDQDIVAAPYPVKAIKWGEIPARHVNMAEPLDEAGLVYVGKTARGAGLKTKDGFATAEYVGTGFMLIKRHVIEQMAKAYPDTKFKTLPSFPATPVSSENLYALFDPMIDKDTGEYISEDYAFCRRWRALGGEIWLDTTARLTHSGAYDFKGNPAKRYAADLETLS